MLFRWFEHSQVYHPSRGMDATGAELGRPFENLSLKTADGVELNAWFYACALNSRRAEFAILICHGNAGNISDRLELYEFLLEMGVSVLAFDYRGYGLSNGKPSEEGTYLDAQAAYQWLRQKGFAGRNIIVYGESLGGGIASEVCVREETGGLVLQSTFTSIPAIGSEIYPWLPVRLIGSIKYDTHSKLPRLKIPVLIMHSREDGLIGYRHSEQNFKVANEPKLFCDLQGAHNAPAWEAPGFREAVEKFLKLVESTHQSSAVQTSGR